MLIEAHLAEGNVREAQRAYNAYRTVALRELRVEPGVELSELLTERGLMLPGRAKSQQVAVSRPKPTRLRERPAVRNSAALERILGEVAGKVAR